MIDHAPARGTPEGSPLADHVRALAHSTWPDLVDRATTCQVIRSRRRSSSDLHEVRLESARTRLDLIVKVPKGSGADRATARPRFAEPAPVEQRAALEYLALAAVQRQVGRLGEPSLEAVRVVGYLPWQPALVTTRACAPTLADTLRHSWPLGPGRAPLRVPFRHAGRWLRVFHDMPPDGHQRTRHRDRDEVIGLALDYTRYLRARTSSPVLARCARWLQEVGTHALPCRLPLGRSHGDFAPRNVFVWPDGRVAASDTLGRWHAPILEDLAAFCMALRTSRVQVPTQGAAGRWYGLQTYERELLAGYFGDDPVPLRALGVYRVIVLLDRWSACVAKGPSARTGLRSRLEHRLFSHEIRACLSEESDSYEAVRL